MMVKAIKQGAHTSVHTLSQFLLYLIFLDYTLVFSMFFTLLQFSIMFLVKFWKRSFLDVLGFCCIDTLQGFPFAKFLRNKTQNFSFFAHQFCAKKQQFAQSFAKVISRKIAQFCFCETQVLRNSATRVLRNSAIS